MKTIQTLVGILIPVFAFCQMDTDAVLKDQDITDKAQVYATDLIVQGSACFGVDCSASESFGFDTHRLKENNLRIHFDDTSASGSFPANDWRITINDSSNGGSNYFSIDDATSGTQVFRVDAGAGNNALRISNAGNVGIGTDTPVLELQVTDGDSPTLRLEQNGSNGWTPQTFDVTANESNFFIRDVTNGSKLPFRIKPNTPDDALYLYPNKVVVNDGRAAALDFIVETFGDPYTFFVDSSEDRIGVGTPVPDTTLHIVGKVKIVDGNQQLGYVLTSDANGQGAWNAIPNELPAGGTNGQILSTNGSGVYAWVNDNNLDGDTDSTNEIELPSGGAADQMLKTDGASNHSWSYVSTMADTDNNTKIHVEESANEDKIRFDIAGTEAMIIDEMGNIGIGTDTPQHKLHVVGDIAKTGNLVGVSDIRVKENISSIENARSIILALDGKVYDFKHDEYQSLGLPHGKQFGLIAQDVEKAVSTLVKSDIAQTNSLGSEKIKLKGINYEQIIPILINAVKEQDHIIQKHHQEMATMKNMISEILKKLDEEK